MGLFCYGAFIGAIALAPLNTIHTWLTARC
jgi:hypothetical protein